MARPPTAPANVPGKPIVARYASPNLSDRIFKVRKDTRLPPNQRPPVKGTAFDGPRASRLATFKFATAVPVPELPEWEDWYYLNERANQDAYNYEITFPGGDKTIPQIVRTYVFLREDYVEIADNSADPIYAGTVLVDRKIIRSEDPVIDSLFIVVQRVYEKLPGVPLVTQTLGAPNLIPEKYRRLVHDVETKQPVSADYVFPTTLTGDQAEVELAQESITKARLQILEQVITTEDALRGHDLDKWGTLRIYESIVDEGDPVDTGYLVAKSTVTPLGNGKSIKITIKYPLDLADTHEFTKTLGQTNLIPEKYRRLVHHIEDDSLVGVDYVFPTSLTGDQASIEYVQENLARARLKITEEVIDVDEDPLLGKELDAWGTLRIYESVVDDGSDIDTGYLILKSTVTPLGNGKSIKITVKYPDALATEMLRQKSLGQSQLIPEKYRSLVTHSETNKLVDIDTYVFPSALVGDQTEVSYIEETMDRARLKITEEVLGVSGHLVGREWDKWGTLQITEGIVNDGTAPDTDYFVLKSTVTPLGNGKSIKITAKYPADLASQTRTDQSLGQPTLIPEKYRALVSHIEDSTFVDPNTYVFPSTLTGDQTQVEFVQETLNRARLKITEEVINTADPLTGREFDKWGTLVITESIVNDGTAVDTGYLVLKSSVTPLGNGKSVKITVNYPSNLAAQTRTDQSLGQTNLIPEKYRALVSHTEANTFVNPATYIFPTALSGDQTLVETIQETLNRARLKITEEVINTADPLTGKEFDKWGTLVITESIVNDGTAVDSDYFVLKSSVTPLGNGKSVKITVKYPTNLASQTRTDKMIGQLSLIPEKYKGLVLHSEQNKFVDPSTYTFPTALTGDQTSVEYMQEALNRARLKIVSEVIGTGSALSGKEHDKWGRLTINESIVNDGTAEDVGYLVLKSSVTPLGNGKSIKITVNYPASLADNELRGQEYDKNLDVVVPYIDTLQPVGTGIGVNRTIVEPQTQERELNRTADTAALEEFFDTYLLEFPGTTNLQLPDVLDSIEAFSETRSGEGFFSETGDAFWLGSGSASLDIRGSGNSSASIMPTVVPQVSQIWGHNVPTKRFMFLMEMPVNHSSALSKLVSLIGYDVFNWPKFKPVGVSIICVGEALTLTTEATAKWMSGGSDSSSQGAVSEGSGASRRLELTINTVRVPPTLHETLYSAGENIILETTDISCSADAFINIFIHSHIDESGTVTGRAFSEIAATTPPNLTDFVGNNYLLDMKAEPYQYGWAMIHCEVVNFSDVL